MSIQRMDAGRCARPAPHQRARPGSPPTSPDSAAVACPSRPTGRCRRTPQPPPSPAGRPALGSPALGVPRRARRRSCRVRSGSRSRPCGGMLPSYQECVTNRLSSRRGDLGISWITPAAQATKATRLGVLFTLQLPVNGHDHRVRVRDERRDYRILFRWCIPAVGAFSAIHGGDRLPVAASGTETRATAVMPSLQH